MKSNPSTTARDWNRVGEEWTATGKDNPVLADHKRRVYLELMEQWTGDTPPKRALKTDLFAEAFNNEEFVSGLTWADRITGIDISSTILQAARRREIGPLHGYVTCDVTRLPFREGAFDLVVSDSTLDHFRTEDEIRIALRELARVLSSGGRLLVSIDNPACLSYPPRWLVRLWMRLGLAPYYVGVTLPFRGLCAALESLGMKVEHQTAILHYPHPDGLVRTLERCACALSKRRLDGFVSRVFRTFERLGNTRWRYLSGRYLAICAVKE